MAKPVFVVEDDRFDVDSIPDSILVIEIGTFGLRFYVEWQIKRVIMWFEEYNFNSFDPYDQQIAEIYEHHKFLKANYWRKIVIVANQKMFSVVKLETAKEETQKAYQKIQERLGHLYPTRILSHPLEYTPYLLVSLVEDVVLLPVLNQYPKGRLEIISAAHSMLKTSAGTDCHQCVHLFFELRQATMIVWKGRELLIADSFGFKDTEDFEFYLGSLIEDFSKKNIEMKFVLHGEITHLSPYFKILERFSASIDFAKTPKNQIFSQYFEDMVEHKYTGMLSSHR